MSFDPNLPEDGSEIIAAELRAQFTGLHSLIPNSIVVDSAQIISGSEPFVSAAINSGVMHFIFGFPPGPPGEVTTTQLNDALQSSAAQTTNNCLSASSANSNAVSPLALAVSDPPTQAEVQAVANKLDELLQALRR
jgi:hypothetical protein